MAMAKGRDGVEGSTLGDILARALRRKRDAAFPAPWRVEIWPGTRRARVFDFYGSQIIAGMNIEKANIIVAAVNAAACFEQLVEALEPLARYYDLNDLCDRPSDDALEIPVSDLTRCKAAFDKAKKVGAAA